MTEIGSNVLPELTRRAWTWVDHDVYFEATWGFGDFKRAFNRKFGELSVPHKFYFISRDLALLLCEKDCMPISPDLAEDTPTVFLWRCQIEGKIENWSKWDILKTLKIQHVLEVSYVRR